MIARNKRFKIKQTKETKQITWCIVSTENEYLLLMDISKCAYIEVIKFILFIFFSYPFVNNNNNKSLV